MQVFCFEFLFVLPKRAFLFYSVKPSKRNSLIRIAQSSDRIAGQQRDRFVKGDLHDVVPDTYRVILYFQNVTWFHGALVNVISFAHLTYETLKYKTLTSADVLYCFSPRTESKQGKCTQKLLYLQKLSTEKGHRITV